MESDDTIEILHLHTFETHVQGFKRTKETSQL